MDEAATHLGHVVHPLVDPDVREQAARERDVRVARARDPVLSERRRQPFGMRLDARCKIGLRPAAGQPAA
jgi:hypothetical protein